MEWQAVVLAMQILIVAISWTLLQKAKSQLSARAAEAPVLAEVRSLQKSVKQLLHDIEQAGDSTSAAIENRCIEANHLLSLLELRCETAQSIHSGIGEKLQEIQSEFAEMRSALDVQSAVVIESAALSPRRRSPRSTEPNSLSGTRTSNVTQGLASPPNNSKLVKQRFEPLTPRESRNQDIYRMADAGETPAQIARATQMSEGEVETLLSLRMQRQ